MRGLGGWYLYEIAICLHVGSLLRHVFRNRLKCHILKSNRHVFRNRLKCHLLESLVIISSLSLITVNVIDYHLHLLQ